MIVNKNIGLRAIEKSDLGKLKDWRNKTEFRKNFREFKELNDFDQDVWYEKICKSKNDYMFGIIELKNNELIGVCGLTYIDWIIRSADFSFYIGKDNLYIEDSLSLDASLCLIKYGFEILNLNKIWMELYEFDSKKLNFFQNNFGFSVDGKLRHNCFFEGKYWDSFILSLLSSEFKNWNQE